MHSCWIRTAGNSWISPCPKQLSGRPGLTVATSLVREKSRTKLSGTLARKNLPPWHLPVGDYPVNQRVGQQRINGALMCQQCPVLPSPSDYVVEGVTRSRAR
jgi:hypothetical protein